MDIFLYSKSPDLSYAAATLADLQALITALADPSTAVNAATINRVQGALQQMVQNDTGESLRISAYDDASTLASWVTDAGTTLTVGLGDPDPVNADTYASTNSFSISSPYRVGTLALNTTQLSNAFRFRSAGCRPQGCSTWFTLHIRKTTGGVTQTVGMIPIQVFAAVLTTTPQTLQPDAYVTTAEARVGYIINASGVSSITGGGPAALDGLEAGSASYPVGCIVKTSNGNIGRDWKLIGTYIAASDVANGQVKPTNSDAVTNPCYWQLI